MRPNAAATPAARIPVPKSRPTARVGAAPAELVVVGALLAAEASDAVGVAVALAELLVVTASPVKFSGLRVPQFCWRVLVHTSWPALLFSFALMHLS